MTKLSPGPIVVGLNKVGIFRRVYVWVSECVCVLEEGDGKVEETSFVFWLLNVRYSVVHL